MPRSEAADARGKSMSPRACSIGVESDKLICLCTGKTFEVRRSEAADARGKSMTHRAFQQLFLQLAEDRHRPRVGLWPFPKAVPPPPPPTEERKQAGFFHSAPAPCWGYCYRQVGVKASSFRSRTCVMQS